MTAGVLLTTVLDLQRDKRSKDVPQRHKRAHETALTVGGLSLESPEARPKRKGLSAPPCCACPRCPTSPSARPHLGAPKECLYASGMEDSQVAQTWSSCLPEPNCACGHHSNYSSATRLGRQKVVMGLASPAGNAVAEGARSCCSKRGREEEEPDDGLRQFKRQLTESFFNFMKSEQPKQLYDLAMALRRGPPQEAAGSTNVSPNIPVHLDFVDSQRPDNCEVDGAHVASVRYQVSKEWEMCVNLRPEERQFSEFDSVRGSDESQASKVSPYLSFSLRMDPDGPRYPYQVIGRGIDGGSPLMASLTSSVARETRVHCFSQGTIVYPRPPDDKTLPLQTQTSSPPCTSLCSVTSLRPRILLADSPRLKTCRLIDWPGLLEREEWSDLECELDGRSFEAKDRQSLSPPTPSYQSPVAVERGNSGLYSVVQKGSKMSYGVQTPETTCLQVVRDGIGTIAGPSLPSWLNSCSDSKLTEFLRNLRVKLVVLLDKGRWVISSLPGTRNPKSLRACEVPLDGPQPLTTTTRGAIRVSGERAAALKSPSRCDQAERIFSYFFSCSVLKLFPFVWDTWVDKSLPISAQNLVVAGRASCNVILDRTCNTWLTEELNFSRHKRSCPNVSCSVGVDERSHPELKVVLFDQATSTRSFCTLSENVRNFDGWQIDVSRSVVGPPQSSGNQAVEAYSDSFVDASKGYTDVKVLWEDPLKKVSYCGQGATSCLWPEEIRNGFPTKHVWNSLKRPRVPSSGKLLTVEVVSAAVCSQPRHSCICSGALENKSIPQLSSGTDCPLHKEYAGDKECADVPGTHSLENRFVLVGGIAASAEPEAYRKDLVPLSSHPPPRQVTARDERVERYSLATAHKISPKWIRRSAGKVDHKHEAPPQLVRNPGRPIYEEDKHGNFTTAHDNGSLTSDESKWVPDELSKQRQSISSSSGRPRMSRPSFGNGKNQVRQQVECPKWSYAYEPSHKRTVDHVHKSLDHKHVKGERHDSAKQISGDLQRLRELQQRSHVRKGTNSQMASDVKWESNIVKNENSRKSPRDVQLDRDVPRNGFVARERDVKTGRDVEASRPVVIVLSDSSDSDSEQRCRSSVVRDRSALNQLKQDIPSIANERQKRPRLEHLSDEDLHVRHVNRGFGTSKYHQFGNQDFKRPKTCRATPFAGRSGRPLEKQHASYTPAKFGGDEGKWTAGITCDLCGGGPSLACGEWYAWCCGKMKASCSCPPQRRSMKLLQKSKAPRIASGYVHRMCSIWSAEVVEQNDYMQDLLSAVRRGLSLKCAHCHKFGATMGCRVPKCRKSFHYPCADLLASKLQLRMWERCGVAIACKEHQHIDYVRDVPNKLFPELHNTTNSIPYLGSNLVCEDLSNSQEAVPIPCTNDVDDEPLPRIKYITQCRYSKAGGVMREGMCPGRAKLAEGCTGCTRFELDDPYAPISVHVPNTKSRCTDWRTDWQHQPMHGRLAYDDFGRLQLGSETIDVVECNARCKCGIGCKNRVLQNGLRVRLEVFKTINRGWGVRTLADLPRGTFVVEYVGELLTHDEADVRGQEYDAKNHSCLFNMDHPDVPQDELLVLDGHSMSNVARFVNHSCDGNLVVCRVYTESIEPKFCRIALFTNRDVWAGTELCYDYSYSTNEMSKEDVQHALRHPETIRCRCGSANCRKVLWRGGS